MDVDKLKLQIVTALGYLIALILSICVHEFGHAWVADRLGDPLPRSQGRVTLDPTAHIDPIGTLLLPLVAVFLSLNGSPLAGKILGWGRPVQISLHARYITRKLSIRTAHALVAIAGPAMNILFGLVLSGAFVAILAAGKLPYEPKVTYSQAVGNVVAMNIRLFFFNLIPCPPLDGGAVLRRVLPRQWDGINDLLERGGRYLLLLLLMTGMLGVIMGPVNGLAMAWLNLLANQVGYTFG